ncbi:hypothetical protein [Streptomyces profundus]|uniref:hypothetical protein n=1 Tax=Streptomyces profundus TaxID=2867410 RepID=UPI001D161B10|nr:hypothetical protein [Streptomyces sp. MA3_2.13]UED84875.1 hypothetical protein K4G22_12210 [Streptomyces sp. MA3_2.13]
MTLLGAPAFVYLVYRALAAALAWLVDQIRRAEEAPDEPPPPAPDPLDRHAALRARIKQLNAASVANYRTKSGELP